MLLCDKLTRALGGWLQGRCEIKFRKPHLSKFEHRVKTCLLATGLKEEDIVHEITLPIRVTFQMRKYLDAAGMFQRGDVLELRIDMAFEDQRGRVVLVEVDGSQHGARASWNRTGEDIQRSLRRDAIKHFVLNHNVSPSLTLIRIGCEFEICRGSDDALYEHIRTSISPDTPSSIPPPPCLVRNLIPPVELHERIAVGLPPSPPSSSFRKSRSEERQRFEKRIQNPSHDPTIRTRFNRKCKDYVFSRSSKTSSSEAAEMMGLLRDRQTASDTRKRPRDDAGFDYSLRWWKLCDYWWLTKGERESRESSTHRKPRWVNLKPR
jgi:hypothetical protein